VRAEGDLQNCVFSAASQKVVLPYTGRRALHGPAESTRRKNTALYREGWREEERAMKGRPTLLSALVSVLVLAVLTAGCGGSSEKADKPYAPNIDPADFVSEIDNKYFPLKPGTTFVYAGNAERDEMTVTSNTKQIMGVECVVVNDRLWEDGKLIEQTYDWYAQDKEGNVWYFGEATKEYKEGKVITEGSWEAGVDGAKPGIMMQASPKVGQSYRQEYYKGHAEDWAQVVNLDETVKVPYGSFEHVLVTKEWTPLEPNLIEHKYYAPGVGPVGPPGGLELIDIKKG
jgi:hypothetical protein